MNCKNCNAPLEDGPFCPVCGTDNSPVPETAAEQSQPIPATPEPELEPAAQQEPVDAAAAEPAEAEPAADNADILADGPTAEWQVPQPAAPKKSNKGTIILGVVLAIAVAVLAYLYATKDSRLFSEPDNEALAAGGVYSDETLEAGSKAMDRIVAKVGDEELTNAEFQIYYWMQFYNFMNSYGSYAAYFGLDATKELSEQDSMEPVTEASVEDAESEPDAAEPAAETTAADTETKMLTWEQYFISTALDSYRQYKALELKARSEGIEIAETYRTYLDNLDADLQTAASNAGFGSPEEYLQASFGAGVTLEDYKAYMDSYLLAISYSSHLQESVTYTDDDISSYYDSKAEEYAAQGVEKIDKNVVNVRHILVKPEQDLDEDGDGTMDASSEEAWAAAEEKANELYAQWQENATEENFAAMATENSDDSGSSSNGGLYENVYPGQMVTEFNDWCFDPSRTAGDHGLVKTIHGYHILYFVSTGDQIHWFETAKEGYISEQYGNMMQDVIDEFSLKVNYRNIVVSTLAAVSSQNTTSDAEQESAVDSETASESTPESETESETAAEGETASEPAA